MDGENHKTDINTLTELFKTNNNIMVKSYNIEEGVDEYRQLMVAAMTNKSAEVLEIIDEKTGKKIICTPDHEIFTLNRGYVMAKNLVEEDELKIFELTYLYNTIYPIIFFHIIYNKHLL